MPREILFRCWHKKLGKMLYPPNEIDSRPYCRDSQGNHVQIDSPYSESFPPMKINLSNHMDWKGNWFEYGMLQDVEFQQYIGLKDINNKKIFEGDIISCEEYFSCRSPGWMRKDNLIVDFSEGCAAFIFKYSSSKEVPLMGNNNYMYRDLQVVGNIFENPDLLK